MPRLLLIFTLFLSACTVAQYGDSFEQRATHIEKSYDKPFDELYTCMISIEILTPNHSTYSTPSMAAYEYNGLTKVVLKKTGANKTQVRSSALRPHYKPENLIDTLDKCAKK